MKTIYSTLLLAIFAVITGCKTYQPMREMVKIPSGKFMMGGEADEDSKPMHLVKLDGFYIDKYEVTQGDYIKLIGKNPSEIENTSKYKWIGDKYPVTNVTWYDAVKYCNARSEAEGLEPCYNTETWKCDFRKNGYRLPTEAEWEYACRAGASTKYYFGDDKKKLIEYANYWPEKTEWYNTMYKDGLKNEDAVWNKSTPRLIPIGTKKPNKWEIFDMLGNVFEWCNDWHDDHYYKISPEINPKGPLKGEYKLIRGDAYNSDDAVCYERSYGAQNDKDRITGFRCVRNAE